MDKSDPVNIYAVAQRAGVSISTVSLAINHPDRVSAATRERIVAIASDLGYRPWAGRTSRGSRGQVAVIAPFSSYPSYALRLNGVMEVMSRAGVDVQVFDLGSAAATPSPLLDALPVRGSVNGVILMGLPLSEQGRGRLNETGPPLVLVDVHEHGFSSVSCDDDAGGYMVGRHLLGLGHETVAFVHEEQRSYSYVSSGMLRRSGLRRALEEAGGHMVDVEVSGWTARDGSLAAELILADRRGVTAAFANHDLLAAGLLEGLRGAGLAAPEDLAVVGYDDGELAFALGLTTVRQPFADTGRQAAELLLNAMARKGGASRVMLSGELVSRGSTLGAQS